MTAVVALCGRDGGGAFFQLAQFECGPSALQYGRQRILAAFQCFQMLRLQLENPAVQRQRRVGRAIEAPGRTRGIGGAQQIVDAGHRRFTPAQDLGDGIGLRTRRGQCAGQRQSTMRLREGAALGCVARLLHRRLRHTRQAGAQLGAIRIDGDRRFIQLARAAAVVRTQAAPLQRGFGLQPQRLRFRHRPQALGNRPAQRKQQRQQQHDSDRQRPQPMRAEIATER